MGQAQYAPARGTRTVLRGRPARERRVLACSLLGATHLRNTSASAQQCGGEDAGSTSSRGWALLPVAMELRAGGLSARFSTVAHITLLCILAALCSSSMLVLSLLPWLGTRAREASQQGAMEAQLPAKGIQVGLIRQRYFMTFATWLGRGTAAVPWVESFWRQLNPLRFTRRHCYLPVNEHSGIDVKSLLRRLWASRLASRPIAWPHAAKLFARMRGVLASCTARA